MYKTVTWNTGSAATRFRHTKKIKREIKRLKKLPDYEYVIMDLVQEKKELERLQAASSQAGGPAHKEPRLKLDKSNWGLPRIIKR